MGSNANAWMAGRVHVVMKISMNVRAILASKERVRTKSTDSNASVSLGLVAHTATHRPMLACRILAMKMAIASRCTMVMNVAVSQDGPESIVKKV
jgi:hypothetical protein